MQDAVTRLLMLHAREHDLLGARGVATASAGPRRWPHLGHDLPFVEHPHDVAVGGARPLQLAAHENRRGSPAPTRTTSG